MNLKNYTSTVSADITIARIERLLVDAGASDIVKQYANGQVTSLIFRLIPGGDGQAITIKLPANVESCLDAFWKEYCRTRTVHSKKEKADFIEQAARTAWKLQQDWVEVQLSLIRLQQIEPMQAFLAYAYDGQSTVYERIKVSGYKALLAAP